MSEKRVSSRLSKLINYLSISSAAKRIISDISVLFLLLVGIIFLISLWTYDPLDQKEFIPSSSSSFSNSIGLIGAYLSYGSYWILGITAWFLLIPALWIQIKYLFTEKSDERQFGLRKIFFFLLGLLFTLISLSVLISIHIDPYDNFYPESSAGFIGLTLKNYSLPYLSIIGSTIVAIFFLLISFTLTANLSWKNLISGIQDKLINSSYFLSKAFRDGLTFFNEIKN